MKGRRKNPCKLTNGADGLGRRATLLDYEIDQPEWTMSIYAGQDSKHE